MPQKRTRQSNIRSTNVNFPSASIPSSTVNNTTTIINSAASVNSTFTPIIPQVAPSATVPTVIPPESTLVPITTTVTVPPLVPAQGDNSTVITPALIVARSLSPQDMPFLNLNDVNLPYAHNNNESIDELINLLAGDQHEQNTDISVNQQHQAPRNSGPNPQRQPRTSQNEMLEELEANPNRRLIFDIVLRYFISPLTSYSIASRLYDLGPSNSLTLSALVNSASPYNRPDKPSQLRMIEELTASNIFITNQTRRNAIQIRKNNNYQ